MLQENLFLYHRKPLAFSILSIRSTPGGQGRGVQRKCGLCSFLPCFFYFPASLVCVYVAWGCWLGKTQISWVVRIYLSSPKLLFVAKFGLLEQ